MWLLPFACLSEEPAPLPPPPAPSEPVVLPMRPANPPPEAPPPPPDPCAVHVDVVDPPQSGPFTRDGVDLKIESMDSFPLLAAQAPGTGCLILSPGALVATTPPHCETVRVTVSVGCAAGCTSVALLQKGRAVRTWTNPTIGAHKPELTGTFDAVKITTLGGEICALDFD